MIFYQVSIILNFYVAFTFSCFASSTKPAATTTTTTPTTTLNQLVQLNSQLSSFLATKPAGISTPSLSSSKRTTTDFAKRVDDIITYIFNYAQSVTNQVQSFVQSYTVPPSLCPYTSYAANITCDPNYIYHSFDGTCNNLKNPLYGVANIPYSRLLPPAYGDGYNSPRSLSVSGNPLPNPRIISIAISVPITVQRLQNNVTHLFPIFGQFLTHDIAGATPITGFYNLGFSLYFDRA